MNCDLADDQFAIRDAVAREKPALHDHGEKYWADRAYGAVDQEGRLSCCVQRMRDPPS